MRSDKNCDGILLERPYFNEEISIFYRPVLCGVVQYYEDVSKKIKNINFNRKI